MEDVIDIDVGDWVAFVRDGKVKYAKVEYISTTPRSSFPQSFAGALLFAIEVKNVRILHTTEGSVRSEYVLECRKAPLENSE